MPARREKDDLDLNRSLIPIGLFGQLPQVIAISPKTGINSLQELIDAARKEPERLLCGTNGSGTFPHLTVKRFVDVARAPITIVPYASGGTNEVTRDILGGRVQMVVTGLLAILGLIQSGDLKPLAIATEKRLAKYPDLPTVSETIPDFTAVGWSVLAAPAGTPDGVVQLVHRTMNGIANESAVRSKLEEMGTFPISMSLGETRAFIEAE
jgi:tripartite-type tricarboxylate transporter receptor subunit TctC